MYPICRYMDSYPQACHSHRDQVSYPYPQHVYPSWESPFNGTSRYFSPGDCSGCWNHAYPPAPLISYPHPQVQVPQHHFHGAYPPCPNICPAYFIPPPQHVVDQGRSHCCGCPNHSCQKKDDNGLKIEEESPGIEPKNSSSSHMARWPAYPYPGFWFPPDHMKDNDHRTPKLKDNDSSSMIQWPMHPYPVFWFPPNHVKDNNHKATEPQGPTPLDRWISMDKNSLKSLREDEEKKIQSQQNGAKRTQLPLPIIWMPSYDQESEENVRDANASTRVVEDFPPKFRIIPVNLLENENCNEKTGEENVNTGSQICPTLPDKGSMPKSIPVKHVEENGMEKLDLPEKEGDNGAEKLSAHVKQKEEKQEKKTSDSGTKKQTSLGRSSKLPPVCLRVDPLPRKKTGNGSSRSPSPPGKKEVKDDQETNEGKAGASGRLNESKKDTTMDTEVIVVGVDRVNGKAQEYGTKDVNRVVEVEDRSTSRKEGEKNENKLDVNSTENHAGTGIEVVTGTGKSEDMAKRVENRKCGQLKGSEEVSLGHSKSKLDESKNEPGVKNMEENMGRECMLSETEAVLHIQAAYRGYEVRKWEPLKKLKQIARIRDQVSCIKQQIHNLEVSSERGQLDEKQKLIIGETIMNLLLQLDTIQGLHPTVREIRKSVARNLVSEQEKLDILSNKVARGLVHAEAGDAPTVGDSKHALEEGCCDGTSDSKESFSQEEHAQTPTEVSLENSLDYSAAEKQEKARELLQGDCMGQKLDNKQLISETRKEQTSSPETGLMVRSELEKGELCCSETEEYIKPPAAPEVGLDSMATDVSELLAREHNCIIEEKAQELQQGVQDETGEALGKDKSPAGDKAEAEAEELHEVQAKEVQQPVVNTQPFTAISPVMLEEGEDAVQEEEVVRVVEDVMNMQEREPLHSSESSESPQQCEDSDSRKEALIMQNQETRQVELVHEQLQHLDNYCAEVDDAVSSSESTIQEVDVKENGSESVINGIYELKELPGYEPVNPEIAAKEGDAEHPEVDILDVPAPVYPVVADREGDAKHPEVDTLDAPAPPYPEAADGEGDAEYSTVEIMDAPVPASTEVADKEVDTEHPNMKIIDATVPTSSARVDLADDNNNQKMLVEENASKEEENTNSALRGIKVVNILQAESTIESECSTEQTLPATTSVDYAEQASVVDMEHKKKLIEENEKLRGMLEKLLEAGNRQLEMISSLSGRVKDLEKKVAHRRKLRLKQHRASKSVSCNKLAPKASVESTA